MKNTTRVAKSSFLLALIGLVLGCVVVPAEGYYDRDHHRYYREHSWHECGEHDAYCR
ncbi:MAG TPA: hypothetical protein VKH13_00745 [Steroidobacteraceae bacterium]|nr:hypothetical protein [Steroidobacteraceae bacterium]